MTGEEYVKAMACLLCEREERSNQINGMLGVLFVLRNRVHAGLDKGFPNNWFDNIVKHGQFSSMTIKGDSQTVYYPHPNDPNFQKILQYIDSVFDDTLPDTLTGGALYYADLNNPSFSKGGWFDRTIIQHPEKYERTAKIGTTYYYKPVGE